MRTARLFGIWLGIVCFLRAVLRAPGRAAGFDPIRVAFRKVCGVDGVVQVVVNGRGAD
ncbi:hypothetical protein SDC9_172985 [bioreactor metagenome]|uniref:Uncharacterized protein n=1 Tax=bioreactor metagenome TaxID=1076179 RepID=A0A645GPG0_9ZZZZ